MYIELVKTTDFPNAAYPVVYERYQPAVYWDNRWRLKADP
jgi:hypothetical protein